MISGFGGTMKREATILTICKIANLCVTILTSMLLTRYLSLEEFGTLSQISLVLSIVTTLCLMGLPNAINFYYPRCENDLERHKFIETFFSLNCILSVVSGLIMLSSIPMLVWYFANRNIYDLYYYALLMPWAKITIQERSNLFVASNNTKSLIIHTVLNSIFLLFIVVLTQIFNESFEFYLTLYILTELAFSVAVYIKVIDLVGKFKFKIDKALCREILVFSIPIGFSDMVNTVSREIDKLMIGGLLDTSMLAIYTNSARELALTVISTSFIAVLMPKVSKLISNKKILEAVELWKKTISFTYIFMCFGVVALVVFAPQVITVLYSEKYLLGVEVFQVYSLILLWRTTYFGMMLNLFGYTKIILRCSILAMVLNVCLNYVLFSTIGFVGPAISTFVSIGVVNVLQLFLTSRIVGIGIIDLFPWKDLFDITILNFILGGIIIILKYFLGIGTDSKSCIMSVCIGICWMCFYFGFVMKKRIIKQWKET